MVIALLHRLLLSFWHRSMKTVSWVVWGGNSQLPVFSVLKISHYWKYFLHLLSRESEWHENALGCFFFSLWSLRFLFKVTHVDHQYKKPLSSFLTISLFLCWSSFLFRSDLLKVVSVFPHSFCEEYWETWGWASAELISYAFKFLVSNLKAALFFIYLFYFWHAHDLGCLNASRSNDSQ